MSLVQGVTATSEDARRVAIAEAIAEMRPRLLAVARSMRAKEPEDLVQTAMEIAVRHAPQLKDPDKLWAWTLRIQTREMFRWSRRLRMAIHGREARDVAELETYADVRAALAKLPPRTRACVVLHHMADLSVAETAHVLGTSPNTVKSQLRLGLRRLRGILE